MTILVKNMNNNFACKKFITFIQFLLCLFWVSITIANGQTDSAKIKNPMNIGLRSHYGFILPHSKSIKEISYSRPWGIDADISWLLLNENAWNYCFCYPRMGFTISYTNFDNPEILGNAFGLNYFVEPFLTYRRKLNFSYRAGLGIVYLDNPYDPGNNTDNLFFSTHFSFLLLLNISLNYKINDRLNTRLSGYYNHSSNGGIKEPNKGINFPTISIGIDYMVENYSLPDREKKNIQLYERKTSFYGIVGGTAKTYSTEEQDRYPVFVLEAGVSRVVARMNEIKLGIEYTADYTIHEKFQRDNNSKHFGQSGILIGHGLLIGRFTFSQILGIYLFNPRDNDTDIYQRYGLTYHINKHLFAGVNLKSHLHVADFLDVRVGWKFNL